MILSVCFLDVSFLDVCLTGCEVGFFPGVASDDSECNLSF